MSLSLLKIIDFNISSIIINFFINTYVNCSAVCLLLTKMNFIIFKNLSIMINISS